MSLKVYVAAAREDKDLARGIAANLERAGLTITCKWWETMETAAVDNKLSRGDAQRYAYADFAGIDEADIFFLLASAKSGTGCWIEFGYALSQALAGDKSWIVCSGEHKRTIFAAVDEVTTFDDHDEATWFVIKLTALTDMPTEPR